MAPSNKKGQRSAAVIPMTPGLDDNRGCNDDSCHLQSDCNVTFLDFFKFRDPLGQLVEDRECQVNGGDGKDDPEDELDDGNSNRNDAIHRQKTYRDSLRYSKRNTGYPDWITIAMAKNTAAMRIPTAGLPFANSFSSSIPFVIRENTENPM